MKSFDDICEYVNTIIDNGFQKQDYSNNFFQDLTRSKIDKKIVSRFNESGLFTSIQHQIDELDVYLSKGKYYYIVEESYSWMGEDRVKDFKQFLENILCDAKKYAGRKRGRKPSTKKSNTKTTNK